MFYEINVSLNGRHLFATAERSLTNERDARALYADFATRFPADQGFKISLTEWNKTGRDLA